MLMKEISKGVRLALKIEIGYCGNCRTKIPHGNHYCEECSKKLRKCIHCGKDTPIGVHIIPIPQSNEEKEVYPWNPITRPYVIWGRVR